MHWLFIQSKRLYLNSKDHFHLHWASGLRIVFVASGFLSLAILVYRFGFHQYPAWEEIVQLCTEGVILYLILYEVLFLVFTRSGMRNHLKERRAELIITVFVIFQWIFSRDLLVWLSAGGFSTEESALLLLSISQSMLAFAQISHILRHIQFISFIKVSPSLIFLGSFAFVISIGTLLLSLPKARNIDISILDLIFTSVSATCVTGLSTIDIGTAFTRKGQYVILALIQIGGLGLMTLTSFFAFFLSGRSSLTQQILMKDLLSEDSIGEVKGVLTKIASFTLVIEAIGASIIYFTTPLELPPTEKLFHSIFHSVSAFCNAGFTLYKDSMTSMTYGNAGYGGVIMVLVLLGGLGFPVIDDLSRKLRNSAHRLSVTTRLVIITSVGLLALGSVLYLVLEFDFTLKNLGLGEKVYHSIFYSITLRTAGFNTLPVESLSRGMTLLSYFFMWVGASPSSTGGGIKTMSFVILILFVYSRANAREKLEIFGREIAKPSIEKAMASVILSIFTIGLATFLLIQWESADTSRIIFEVISAFGTVGLSQNLTAALSPYSKIVLCVVMLCGRVGALTFLSAFLPKRDELKIDYPKEYVIVG